MSSQVNGQSDKMTTINDIAQLNNVEIHDEGCTIYRNAILKWQKELLESNKALQELCKPLIDSQVLPWICGESSIFELTKAYQNMCEIVMFSLDYFSDDSDMLLIPVKEPLEILDPQGLFANKSWYYYSYAMSAIFDIFSHLLDRPEFKDKCPNVACISQNYFETLAMIQKIAISKEKSISLHKHDCLEDIIDLPDILVADIHPNNGG